MRNLKHHDISEILLAIRVFKRKNLKHLVLMTLVFLASITTLSPRHLINVIFLKMGRLLGFKTSTKGDEFLEVVQVLLILAVVLVLGAIDFFQYNKNKVKEKELKLKNEMLRKEGKKRVRVGVANTKKQKKREFALVVFAVYTFIQFN
mmetsp:Transcript_2905/g.4936  ORF Transcript_2905/g.4936 Transcript_2905/m.4936 type:complete len:148 (+) Transcript_2905:221-664(+)